MIDIHAHILPHLDDGSPDWASSMAMAELAAQSGVIGIAATPHCGLPGQNLDGRAQFIRDQLTIFQTRILQAGLRLAVCEGMEIFGTPDTAEQLRTGQLITLNRSRYPLIEFPFRHYGRETTRILDSVLSLGYCPIVAHPERYEYVQRNPELLNLWSDMGCLFQLNRGSLLGRFGRMAEELAWGMAHRGFACAVASDAHSSVSRTTWMKDIRDLLQKELSKEAAHLLLDIYPRQLLADETIDCPEPQWF